MRAGTALGNQPVGEEGFQDRRQHGHDGLPSAPCGRGGGAGQDHGPGEVSCTPRCWTRCPVLVMIGRRVNAVRIEGSRTVS
ncbi:MAG: hypothetical protein JO345_37135 [Streptosporangiaceae bacterium]|nr:hypothetical protein [Streptosporangiaceae bacterium]